MINSKMFLSSLLYIFIFLLRILFGLPLFLNFMQEAICKSYARGLGQGLYTNGIYYLVSAGNGQIWTDTMFFSILFYFLSLWRGAIGDGMCE